MIEPTLYNHIADKMKTNKSRFVTKVVVDSVAYNVVTNGQAKLHATFKDLNIGIARIHL